MNAHRAIASRRCPAERGREGWLEFESDAVAVHVLTEEGIISGTNRTFDLMFGSEPAEFIGLHHAALNNRSVAANLRLLAEIRLAISRDGVWRGTLANRDVRGIEFKTRAHIYPMRSDGVRRFVCFQETEHRGVAPSARQGWAPALTAAAIPG